MHKAMRLPVVTVAAMGFKKIVKDRNDDLPTIRDKKKKSKRVCT